MISDEEKWKAWLSEQVHLRRIAWLAHAHEAKPRLMERARHAEDLLKKDDFLGAQAQMESIARELDRLNRWIV
jgi:hypothetical protein